MERYELVVRENPFDGGAYAEAVVTEDGNYTLYADAQATVEALQRERDHAKKMEAVQKEVADNQTWHVRELRAALDAEREKVKGLEAHMNRLDKHKAWLLGHCRKLRHDIQFEQRTARDFQDLWRTACDQREAFETKLSQIQALVRAAVERWRAQTNVKEGISFRMAMKELEATLDATTPATRQE